MPSDLEQLLDMGFDKERAEIAVKKSGGCRLLPGRSTFIIANSHPVQGALQWLEDNQDKSLEDIQAAEKSKEGEADEDETKAEIAALESGQEAKSLVCNECGKRFRNEALASYHASKT